jgi:hypothetical protein
MKLRSYSLLLMGALTVCGWADDKAKPTTVDAGSFGIVVNGSRVATESFKIEQRGGSSFVISELKLDGGDDKKAAQTAELELTGNGMLKKYTWKEVRPGTAQIVITPQDDSFLAVRISETSTAPAKDLTHALSAATNIMDDNFFSQMQVLAWKYMASGCRASNSGQNECVWEKKQLPILNPHQQESLLVTMEFNGEQRFKLKGQEHVLKAFKLKGETGEWSLWFNEENKLVRVVIAAENT